MPRIFTFTTNVLKIAANKVVKTITGIFRHAETVTIMTFSALGINAFLGELPFYMYAPMWIESAMVIPVLSVLAVSLLAKSAEKRARRRVSYAYAT